MKKLIKSEISAANHTIPSRSGRRTAVSLVIVLFIAGFGQPCFVYAAPADDWTRGNEAYVTGDYSGAIAAYNDILDEGLVSSKLLYNLGNAYFKNGQLGRAILQYNRALILKPGDGDTRWNLEIAESRVKVRIEPVPQFFLARWVGVLRGTIGVDGWAVVALVMLAVAAGATLLYLLAGRRILRKTGFYGAVVAVVMFIIAFCFSAVRPPVEAIVMSEAATVKSAPDAAARDAFILYEGTKVQIVSTLGVWSEIEIADGNKGWIASAAIETIH